MKNILKILYKVINPDKLFIPITKDLKNTVVFVSGASRGVGLATAEVLVKNSAKIVLFSRNTSLQEEKLAKGNSNVLIVTGNVTREADVKAAVKTAVEKFGTIDVLINSTGKFDSSPIDKTSLEDFSNTIATNLTGTFLTCREVIPLMKKQGDGLIVNIGSKISRNTAVEANKVTYATSKYALEGFTLSLSRELKNHGIRVTCLIPGTINTFLSVKNPEYLSPYRVADIITMLIRFSDVDFESIVFKSKHQEL